MNEQLSVRETVLDLLNGKADSIEIARQMLAKIDFFHNIPARFASLIGPMAVWGICCTVLTDKAAQLCGKFCACALAYALFAMGIRTYRSAAETAQWIARLCESAAPVLTTLLSATGGLSASAVLTPASSFAAQMCTSMICKITLPLAACAGVLAVCPAFSERFGFQGIRKLVTSLCGWLHGGMLGLFTGMLSLRGMLKTGADSLALQTARYTVDSLLPVVGGDVADSLGLLIASAKAVHAAIGGFCCVVMILFCAEPVVAASVSFLLVRVCVALAEPFGIKPMTALLEGFSGVLSAMLAAIVCAVLLFVILFGASAAMAGNLG